MNERWGSVKKGKRKMGALCEGCQEAWERQEDTIRQEERERMSDEKPSAEARQAAHRLVRELSAEAKAMAELASEYADGHEKTQRRASQGSKGIAAFMLSTFFGALALFYHLGPHPDGYYLAFVISWLLPATLLAVAGYETAETAKEATRTARRVAAQLYELQVEAKTAHREIDSVRTQDRLRDIVGNISRQLTAKYSEQNFRAKDLHRVRVELPQKEMEVVDLEDLLEAREESEPGSQIAR